MKKHNNRASSKEKKDGFMNKIKQLGKNISIDFAEVTTSKSNSVKTPTKIGFSNQENWFLFAAKAINIQCIEEINNILHSIELDPKEASEILMYLYKKYQIKSNDIQPLLESQQKRLVQLKFEPNFIIKKKKKNIKKIEIIGISLFAVKMAISYLDIEKDGPVKLLLINKKWNSNLQLLIYERYLNRYNMTPNSKIKIWIKMLNPVRINLKN